MIMKIYTVFDSKLGAYGTPNFLQSDGVAHRAFSDHVNDERTPINKHPADYSMWHIGDYDDGSAEIASCKPRLIVQGAAVFVPKNVGPALPGMEGLVTPSGPSKQLPVNGKAQ